MQQTKSSLWKIQNKPMFFLIVGLYLVLFLLNSFQLLSKDTYEIYSFIYLGFCIGAVVTTLIMQPEFIKENFKRIIIMVCLILLSSLFLFL